jgi:hypothetical protein
MTTTHETIIPRTPLVAGAATKRLIRERRPR